MQEGAELNVNDKKLLGEFNAMLNKKLILLLVFLVEWS
jgi:hypothetical protein